MCEFINDTYVMPGFACCGCRTYNGMQRRECRGCGRERHQIELSPGILQCACAFAYVEGQRPLGGKCPVCGADLPGAVAAAPLVSEEA